MAEIKDIYKLLVYVDSERYERHIDNKEHNAEQAMMYLLNIYEKDNKVKRRLALRTLQAAFKLKYLTFTPSKSNPNTFIIDIEPEEGRHLLGTNLWGLWKSGLIDESLKAYGTTKATVEAVIIAVMTSSGLAALITYWITRQ